MAIRPHDSLIHPSVAFGHSPQSDGTCDYQGKMHNGNSYYQMAASASAMCRALAQGEMGAVR